MNDSEKNIEEILAGMSLDQKAGQIIQVERQSVKPREIREYHIGAVLSGGGSVPGQNNPEDWIAMNDAYWGASMETSDGGVAIPTIYGIDATHGHSTVRGAVVFPHNIGLGAARDPELMERIARVTAREIAATGLEWNFAPTLAVARDDRWGRTYESYSEHPDVVCSYVNAVIRGLQGDYGEESVIACAKHWVGDGATMNGIDQGDSSVSEAELRNIHIPPYRLAIDAGILTIMASLSSWKGRRIHGHKYLITDILKGELGFTGVVISDWDGIDTLSEDHTEAVETGLNAGLDMLMVTTKWKLTIKKVKELVEDGRIPVERLDDAVRRILRVKSRFKMFTRPRPAERTRRGRSFGLGSREHREVAREAVRKSLVLLKNRGSILPLDKSARIFVAGKNADNRGHQCGGFTIAWQGVSGNEPITGGTSIWEGIKTVAHRSVLSVTGDGGDADPSRHDIAVVVIGELPYAEMMGDIRSDGSIPTTMAATDPSLAGNTTPRPHDRDNEDASAVAVTPATRPAPYGTSLSLRHLHPEDLDTILSIAGKGIPVVTVLICGRPLEVNRELEASHAFAVAWLPGSEGQGVADVLFGDYDFTGKLSFSWPRHDSENWNIGDEGYNPLFPYGYGLTYGSRHARTAEGLNMPDGDRE